MQFGFVLFGGVGLDGTEAVHALAEDVGGEAQLLDAGALGLGVERQLGVGGGRGGQRGEVDAVFVGAGGEPLAGAVGLAEGGGGFDGGAFGGQLSGLGGVDSLAGLGALAFGAFDLGLGFVGRAALGGGFSLGERGFPLGERYAQGFEFGADRFEPCGGLGAALDLVGAGAGGGEQGGCFIALALQGGEVGVVGRLGGQLGSWGGVVRCGFRRG